MKTPTGLEMLPLPRAKPRPESSQLSETSFIVLCVQRSLAASWQSSQSHGMLRRASPIPYGERSQHRTRDLLQKSWHRLKLWGHKRAVPEDPPGRSTFYWTEEAKNHGLPQFQQRTGQRQGAHPFPGDHAAHWCLMCFHQSFVACPDQEEQQRVSEKRQCSPPKITLHLGQWGCKLGID